MEPDDASLAAQLAETAGRLLIDLRRSALLDGKALGATGDAIANRFLVDALRAVRPNDALLSEEEVDQGTRLASSRVWIIDPLDGTREFGEQRDDWAVHVALSVEGKPAFGAVALPGLNLVLRSDQPTKVPPPPERLRLVVSRSRPAREAQMLGEQLGAEILVMGSAGAKAMAVIRGQADIYLHSGGQYEWDSCAPVAVALAHGLHCSRIDGSSLIYNQRDVSMPDLLICRQQHTAMVLERVKSFA